jgi:segregation and condensation protein B
VEPASFNLKSVLEALIFAADEPVSIKQLEELFQGPPEAYQNPDVTADAMRSAIAELNEEYDREQRSYRIIQVGGGYQFATRQEFAEWVGKLYKEKGRRKLSHAALETLAIIAYRQPVTKPEIEAIRGVNADYVLHRLLERGLVTITGRASTVGRPLLYGTTREFLKHFGINELFDLPKPREIEEIMAESNLETDRRILEAESAEEPPVASEETGPSTESLHEPSKTEISPDGLLQPPNLEGPSQPEDEGGDSSE